MELLGVKAMTIKLLRGLCPRPAPPSITYAIYFKRAHLAVTENYTIGHQELKKAPSFTHDEFQHSDWSDTMQWMQDLKQILLKHVLLTMVCGLCMVHDLSMVHCQCMVRGLCMIRGLCMVCVYVHGLCMVRSPRMVRSPHMVRGLCMVHGLCMGQGL